MRFVRQVALMTLPWSGLGCGGEAKEHVFEAVAALVRIVAADFGDVRDFVVHASPTHASKLSRTGGSDLSYCRK